MPSPLHPSRVASIRDAIASDELVEFRHTGEIVRQKYGVPPGHVSKYHRWRLSGVGGVVLSTVKIGGRRFVKPSDVVAFMQKLNGIEQPQAVA